MSRFPNDPWSGFRQSGFPVPPGEGVPSLGPNVGPRIARFNLPRALGAGQNMTLAALVKRQQELADQGGDKMPLIQSWTQGASHMLDKFLTGYQTGTVNRQLDEGNAMQGEVLSSADPNTGLIPDEQIDRLTVFNPELAYKLLSDRAAQRQRDIENARADQELEIARQKAAGEVGAWKPSDIATRADDYMKAAATYNQASPTWTAIQSAATVALDPSTETTGRGTADYDMIVGFAKLLDPNSVVREGEVKSASMTEGMLNQVQSMLNQWTSKGMLNDETRRAIMTQSSSRMSAYYSQAKQYRDWISEVATRHNVNPDDVVPPLGEFTPWTDPTQRPQPNPDNPDVVDSDAPADGLQEGQTATDDEGNKWVVKNGMWVPQQQPQVQ